MVLVGRQEGRVTLVTKGHFCGFLIQVFVIGVFTLSKFPELQHNKDTQMQLRTIN